MAYICTFSKFAVVCFGLLHSLRGNTMNNTLNVKQYKLFLLYLIVSPKTGRLKELLWFGDKFDLFIVSDSIGANSLLTNHEHFCINCKMCMFIPNFYEFRSSCNTSFESKINIKQYEAAYLSSIYLFLTKKYRAF